MCHLRDCSVRECPETEVDRTIDNIAFRGWVETNNPWTHNDDTDNGI